MIPAYLAVARRIVAATPERGRQLPLLVSKLREEEPTLFRPQAEECIALALREIASTYYAVAPGIPLIEGPFIGLKGVYAGATSGYTPVRLPDATEQFSPMEIIDYFLDFLPRERDERTVSRLVVLYLMQLPHPSSSLIRLRDNGAFRTGLIQGMREKRQNTATVIPLTAARAAR